jgi:hypothetical protein
MIQFDEGIIVASAVERVRLLPALAISLVSKWPAIAPWALMIVSQTVNVSEPTNVTRNPNALLTVLNQAGLSHSVIYEQPALATRTMSAVTLTTMMNEYSRTTIKPVKASDAVEMRQLSGV